MRRYKVGDEPVPGYKLREFLGAGYYGQVWKAVAPGGIEKALKIIGLERTHGIKEYKAIKLVKELKHPNLMPLDAFWLKDEYGQQMDFGAEAVDSFNLQGKAVELIIAMGLGDKSLADVLAEHRQKGEVGIPRNELLRYLEKIADAIDYLNHPEGGSGGSNRPPIQHCDVKPANILLAGAGVWLCDFGLAKVVTGEARKSTGFTPAYMAPELVAQRPSRSTDQYSLAITYVELATGELPVHAETIEEVIRGHACGELDLSKLTPAEQQVVRKACAFKPDDRYPLAVEFVRALRRANNISSRHSWTDSPLDERPLEERIGPGFEVVPGYKLKRLLGRGGYGEVWEATAPGGGRPVAIKLVRNLETAHGKQEFRSLDLVKDREHDHLLRLHSFWLLDQYGLVIPDELRGQPGAPEAKLLVVITELAAKNFLQRLTECQKEGLGGVPPAELLRSMIQAASAIDYLNQPERAPDGEIRPAIQHRDIKPENLLLSRTGVVWVSDFGLAKAVDGSGAKLQSASVGMTLAYAAPEMLQNRRVTARTDQYSLGVTYFKLRTGELPFAVDLAPYEVILAHVKGQLDLGLLDNEAERAVVARATQVDPEQRFESCTALVEALAQALGITLTRSSPSGLEVAVPAGLSGGEVTAVSGRTGQPAGSGPNAVTETPTAKVAVLPTIEREGAVRPARAETVTARDTGSPVRASTDLRQTSLPEGLTRTEIGPVSLLGVKGEKTDPQKATRPKSDWRQTGGPPRKGKRGVWAVTAVALVLAGAAAVAGFLAVRGGHVQEVREGQARAVRGEGLEKLRQQFGTLLASRQYPEAARFLDEKLSGERGLYVQLVNNWVESIDQTVTNRDAKEKAFKQLLGLIKDVEVSAPAADRLAALSGAGGAPADAAKLLIQARGLLQPDAKALQECRATLRLADASRPRAGIKGRVEALTAVTEAALGVVGTTATPDAEHLKLLNTLKQAIAESRGRLQEPEQQACQSLSRALAAQFVERLVPNLKADSDWAKVAELCQEGEADQTAWVVACRAECLAEQLQHRDFEDQIVTQVLAAAQAQAKGGAAEGYPSYALARLLWERPKKERRAVIQDARAAAQALSAAVPDPKAAGTAWRVEFRTRRAADLFQKAARQLRRDSTPLKPFEPADAAAAFAWLDAADSLLRSLKDEAPTAAKIDLALAAGAKTNPAAGRALALTAELTAAPALAKLGPADACALWLVRARASEELGTTEGRLEAARCYTNLLRTHKNKWELASAAVLYREVIRPLWQGRGKGLLGDPPQPALKGPVAGLFNQIGELFRGAPAEWSRLEDLRGDFWGQVAAFFAEAARLDPKTEYVVYKIYCLELQADKRLTDSQLSAWLEECQRAITNGPDNPWGYILSGHLLVARSKRVPDEHKKVGLLRDATAQFQSAKGKIPPQDADDIVRKQLYQEWSVTCLLLGNWTTDKAEREKNIRQAAEYARTVLQIDPKNFDGMLALAYALEDIAWKLGEVGNYSEAATVFERAKASSTRLDDLRPWLGRGRALLRWSRALPDKDPARSRYLLRALEDLKEVTARGRAPVEVCEGKFWIAECSLDLLALPNGDTGRAEELFRQAITALGESADLAEKNHLDAWAIRVLDRWSSVELNKADQLFRDDRDKSLGHLQASLAAAQRLRRFSEVLAAWREGAAREYHCRFRENDRDLWQAARNAYAAGLGKGRAQEAEIEFDLYLNCHRMFLEDHWQPDREEALKMARAAEALVKRADLGDECRGRAIGGVAECEWIRWKVLSESPERKKLADQIVSDLREAIRLAPDRSEGRGWRRYAAFLLCNYNKDFSKTDPESLAGYANLLSEACRLFHESRPSKESGWLDLSRETDDIAMKVLPLAIEKAESNSRSWEWKWQMAELLSVPGAAEDRSRARKLLAEVEQSLPKDCPARFVARIRELRGFLEN